MATPTRRTGKVLRFRVSLRNIEPEIWRIIEVPQRYTFWDLHVAIQDAMGWLDYHLHAFSTTEDDPETFKQIGIPDEFEDDFLPGWDIPIKVLFDEPGEVFLYRYDFGDDWEHEVALLA
ncbi:MAG: plasmid pRiA4b ORF-3 family protein, partial [Candidatus Hydrogenedentales bacterium]